MFSTFFIRKTRIIKITDIGDVAFEKNRKARRINIRVHPSKGVRVTVPYGVTFSLAEAFVRSKTPWIIKHQRRLEQMGSEPKKKETETFPIDRQKARQILTTRLCALADRYGFKFNKIFLRNQKSRWGSCSAKNNINLNYKLMILPEELREYVILHELVHTRIKNHSPKFWVELSKYISDPKQRSKELRNIGAGLL